MNWIEAFRQAKAGLSLEESARKEAEEALNKYPFFALARMIVAKSATKQGDPRAKGFRFLASLYAPHRQYYAFFMEERTRPQVSPPPRQSRQEARDPSASPPAKEESPTSSSDESGPAEMPLSPAYNPRLQGWLRARMRYYKGWSLQIQQNLICPPLSASPTPTEPAPPPTKAPSHDEQLAESLQPLTSLEPPQAATPSSSPTEAPAGAPTFPPEKESLPLLKHEKALPAHSLESASATSSLTLLLLPLQFELPPQRPAEPPAQQGPSPPASQSLPEQSETAPSKEAPPASAPLEKASSSNPGQAAESSTESPPVPASSESTPPSTPLEPISALTRPYTPLEVPSENPSVHLPIESEMPEPTGITKQFIPLETPSPLSENPIRLLVPFEIDPETSIHLPVPEPTSSTESPQPPPSPPPTQTKSPTPSTPAFNMPAGWRSFLTELETPLSQSPAEALKPQAAYLEKIRQEFIRQLLEARKQRQTPPSEESLTPTSIDKLLELIETFQPKASQEETSWSLAVPEAESQPPPPLIYTETMARLCWSQGDLPLAIEIYEKLKTRHPDKASYYETEIARIKRGEQP